MKYILALVAILFSLNSALAAPLVPAFGTWCGSDGVCVDAGKQNISTMQVPGTTFSKPGGKPTMALNLPDWIAAERYSTLSEADAAAVAAGKALVISSQWNTVPSALNAYVHILPGGRFNNSGGLVFLHQPHVPDGYQPFIGSGAVTGMRWADIRWFGALVDGSADDTAAMAKTAAALTRGGRLLKITGGTSVISTASSLALDGITLEIDGVLKITSSATPVFTVASGFTMLPGWRIETTTEYSNGDTLPQAIFTTAGFSFAVPATRATGVRIGRGTATGTVSATDGSKRGGRLFLGYFAESNFDHIETANFRDGIYSYGEDVSGINVTDCKFRNAERGVVISGYDPHIGSSLISRQFVLSRNQLINTATQATNYNVIQGRELYNLQNIGSIVMTDSISEYAIERAVYCISVEDIVLTGFKIKGSEGIKFSGDNFDLSGTGGLVVDKKSRNIVIGNIQLDLIARNKNAFIHQFVDTVMINGVIADGNLSQAHSVVYIESNATHVTIKNIKARDFKRGMVWFSAVKDLPGNGGTLPARPFGTYPLGFIDITIEDNEGDQVCSIGSDSAYVPTRTVPYIYTLLADDLTAVLTNSSRVWIDLRIRRNVVNPNASRLAGTSRYRATSTTKAFIDINYVNRLTVTENIVNDLGGDSLTGIKIGSASMDVTVKHSVPQVTNFDTVPAIASPLYVSMGSELNYIGSQLFSAGNYASYRYLVIPDINTGSGSSSQLSQTQDIALGYRAKVGIDGVVTSTSILHLSGPAISGNRDYITGVLNDGTTGDMVAKCTSAFVMGEVFASNSDSAKFVLNAPYTAFTTALPISTTWTSNWVLSTFFIGGTAARGIVLTNNSGATRTIKANIEYVVHRASVN